MTSGPYRWFAHPNYLIVAGEIAILPLAFDAFAIAVGFSACNALLLIRAASASSTRRSTSQLSIRETLPRRSSTLGKVGKSYYYLIISF